MGRPRKEDYSKEYDLYGLELVDAALEAMYNGLDLGESEDCTALTSSCADGTITSSEVLV